MDTISTEEPQTLLSRFAYRIHRLSVRRGLLVLLAMVLFGLVVGVRAGVGYFVFRTERSAWLHRQQEATQNAAASVQFFQQEVEAALALVSELDRSYLESNPEILAKILSRQPALLEVIRLDKNGQVWASAAQENSVLSSLFTIKQSEWFRQARLGQVYWGKMQLSTQNEPYLIISLPANDGGVVAARLSLHMLWDVVSAIQFGETGRAYMVNAKGLIVAHRDPEIVLAYTSVGGRPEIVNISAAPNNHWRGEYVNFQGERVVGTSTAVFENRWTIITEITSREAYANTVNALLLLGGGLLIFSIAAAIITNRILERLIFNPVEWLRTGADQIGQGDLDYRIRIARLDEVGQVAQSFNNMAGRLKDRESALAEARDRALEASRLKSRLLANVSHDLRTPLNAIIGYADMLREGIYGGLNQQQTTAVSRMMANTGRLLNLINSLLDQAQMEAGTLKLQSVPFTPAVMLDQVTGMMSVLAQSKRLALTAEISPSLPDQLVGDAQRLQQILVNLISNAIKFTDSGGSVYVCLDKQDERYWSMQVSDTGHGIPLEAQEYIFEPFRQVDDSSTREQGGTGLGLAIVKQLTHLMGGEVQLSSEIGHGTTFTVLLPLDNGRKHE